MSEQSLKDKRGDLTVEVRRDGKNVQAMLSGLDALNGMPKSRTCQWIAHAIADHPAFAGVTKGPERDGTIVYKIVLVRPDTKAAGIILELIFEITGRPGPQ